ncbi:unnamed protein product [Moneuplotes crassus]|uniref:Uncharacterized protein n=1 Tax=Euplotes crassus TaxID=5936 RepID=A0AAD1Y6R5_EUPCR|nr:unnamed protein product [Moneuplotes crassus]
MSSPLTKSPKSPKKSPRMKKDDYIPKFYKMEEVLELKDMHDQFKKSKGLSKIENNEDLYKLSMLASVKETHFNVHLHQSFRILREMKKIREELSEKGYRHKVQTYSRSYKGDFDPYQVGNTAKKSKIRHLKSHNSMTNRKNATNTQRALSKSNSYSERTVKKDPHKEFCNLGSFLTFYQKRMMTSNGSSNSVLKYEDKPDFELDFPAYCKAQSILGDDLKRKRRNLSSIQGFKKLDKSDTNLKSLLIQNSSRKLQKITKRIEGMMNNKRETIFDRQKDQELEVLLNQEINTLKSKHGIQIMSKKSKEIIEKKTQEDPNWRRKVMRSRISRLLISESDHKSRSKNSSFQTANDFFITNTSVKKGMLDRRTNCRTSFDQPIEDSSQRSITDKVFDAVKELKRKHKRFLKFSKRKKNKIGLKISPVKKLFQYLQIIIRIIQLRALLFTSLILIRFILYRYITNSIKQHFHDSCALH